MLNSILENLDIAKPADKGICQSRGYPTSWITFGDGDFPDGMEKVIMQVMGKATEVGYLRPSIVDPLTRENSGNNTGKGVPNIEYEYVPVKIM